MKLHGQMSSTILFSTLFLSSRMFHSIFLCLYFCLSSYLPLKKEKTKTKTKAKKLSFWYLQLLELNPRTPSNHSNRKTEEYAMGYILFQPLSLQ